MKLINVIASLALIVATGACSKEEKKNEEPAAAAAPVEGAAATQAMADKAISAAGAAAAVAEDQAAADVAAAKDMAAAANDMAEAAGDMAQAAGDSAAALPADFGDKVTAAMNEIIAAAEVTKGDCTKMVTTVAPVIVKHKATFETMGKTKDSKEAQAWVMANMAQMQKFSQAMMPIAMCAMKDPKLAEILNQMK